MRSYLITGAFGHIGAFLVRRLLLEPEAQVSALVRPTSNPWRLRDVLDDSRLHVLRADLGDSLLVARVMSEVRAQTVVHCAWEGVTGAARNDTRQITANINTSLALFEAARDAGCTTWAGVGSQAEYGSIYREPRREDMAPHPETAYGVAKTCVCQATEKMAQLSEMRFLWFRVFSTYGPQDDYRHLLPGLIRDLLKGNRPALTPGEQQWDYLYVADAADAMARLLQTPAASGVYNIAFGQASALREVISLVRDLIDPALPVGFGDLPYRPDQVMLLEADISRLTQDTGWVPQTSLREGLKRTLQYYRAFPTTETELA